MRTTMMNAACVVALCLAAGAALAQAPGSSTGAPSVPRPMEIKAVKPGVYMVLGGGGNAAFVVGTDGVVLVDTKSPGQTNFNELNARIKSVTALPVTEVLITHHHPDHSGNIGLFEDGGIPVAGHRELVAALQRFIPPSGVTLSPPNVTFGDSLVVKSGGVTAEAHHFASGHTSNDCIVYFSAHKVVAAGDEVENTPNIDYPFGGSIAGWLKSLDGISRLDFDFLIPGHGAEPMTRTQFLSYKKNAETFAERGRAAVKAGVTKDKLLVSIATDDLGWPITTPFWTAPARLDGLYAELSQWPAPAK